MARFWIHSMLPVAAAVALGTGPANAAGSCDALAQTLRLPNVTITLAAEVPVALVFNGDRRAVAWSWH